MSRRSSGLAGVWAEAQRQQQRQREAQQRAVAQQQRQQRAYERDRARAQREQQAAYRQGREADARLRTEELEGQVARLGALLAQGCRAAPFRVAALTRPEAVAPFEPGQLGRPVPMPDPAHYQAQGGWTVGRRAQAQQEAQARYQHDWAAAQAAEAHRVSQLAAYRAQYDAWAAGQLAEVRAHNAGLAQLVDALRAGDPGAAVDYFSAALYASDAWPEGFPRQVAAAFDRGARQLVLDWELPGIDVVPEVKSVRYVASSDQEKETARPVTQRRALYRDVLAQCVLLVLRDLFAADEFGVLESVVVNGFVDDVDPATGRRAEIFLAAVSVARDAYAPLNLGQVSAVDCLVEAVRGQLSARPDQRAAVRPGRRPADVGTGVVSHGGGGEPDLFTMDPIEFEGLVAELFRARGMQALTTQRSNDGGVDVEALDPDPISGGRIIVQVKRYRNTVPPTAVRDLYGTVQGAGANKGVLVTTSGFGPGSYGFAEGKPLTLVSGAELVDLLHQHGLRGRLGAAVSASSAGEAEGAGGVPAQRGASSSSAGSGSSEGADDFNVLGMVWAGAVALDVCALVCRGARVLAEDHFVFFNNPQNPGSSVRMVPGVGGDRAAVRVVFDALPAGADRLVLVAAVDPEVHPDQDLAGFTEAAICLRDAAGRELDRLPVADGRPGETALVLGSFRRRAGGDWDFVAGGKGYRGGLGELVGEYGVAVA
ncbi:restriction endonuclease [Streptomyces sp. NBC_00083]|uniref:restriction endonuclease n=1 Tax=Streptomyces sp. NBC_00083 TaxID=2975647 RepID=UPI002259EB46|nr:restriction endonuclease [Streptomyces sp. NBC_00083]MCX5387840.1 restriction endonuclease [Streptomyces sp. NBC_00083]